MKKSDIYEIAVKILGLYLLLDVIGTIWEIITLLAVNNETEQNSGGSDHLFSHKFIFANIVTFVLMSGFALLLIIKNKAITKLISNQSDYSEDVKLFAKPAIVFEIAIVLTGLLMIAWTIPDFSVKLRNYIRAEQFKGWHANYEATFLITGVIKIIIGLFALVSAKPLAKFFSKNIKQTGEEV